MEWREYILKFLGDLVIFIIALVGGFLLWATPLWIVTIYQDAKKWREREKEDRYYMKKNSELEKKIEELEYEKEGSNAIIDDYIGYTGIYPREISEKLEKRNKRKKRK